MKDIKVLSKTGKSASVHKVSQDFPVPKRINRHTIFETVNAENQNRRQGTHDTKNKSEVSGTGKKPYKQKHTGRARQGSKRNPHYRGGGIVFGPTPEKNYCVKVNKKVFKIAFITALYQVIESEQVAILESNIVSDNHKTKEFSSFLKSADLNNKKILLIVEKDETNLSLSARNIPQVNVKTPFNCSVRDLLNQNYLLLTEKAMESLQKRIA